MKKENLKQEMINSITDYVMGAIDNDFVEEQMIAYKIGVYIAPAAGEEDNWADQGCVIVWKDTDGNAVKSELYQLGEYAASFGDLVVNGRHYVEAIVEHIYNIIFGAIQVTILYLLQGSS